MAKSRQVRDAFDRLAASEEEFLHQEFLAPVVRGGRVNVRIAAVICTLSIEPNDFEGWGVFQPTSHSHAKLVRPARLLERERYLRLFPLVRLIFADRRGDDWLAIPAHRGDTRLRIEGLAPVRLVEEAQLFEIVQSRFDGIQFWFAGQEPSWDPATGAYLRQCLDRLQPPDEVQRPGLTAEERLAYAIGYWPRWHRSEEAQRFREEDRLRQALAHAGADLKDFLERGDVYTVTYEVDGRRHVSAVSKRDLSVQMAGICLSGQDKDFDLQSLVGVIREAEGADELVRVGQQNRGMEEAQYWYVHPRQGP